MRHIFVSLLLSAFILTACTPGTVDETVTPAVYNPFVPLDGNSPGKPGTDSLGTPQSLSTPTEIPFIIPTAIPLEQLLPTPRPVDMPYYSPTPDIPRIMPTPRQDADQYIVQSGDTLGTIAETYGVGLESLMEANNLSDANVLEVGQTLLIPVPEPGAVGSDFKIIPDSELVYGPASAKFDVDAFLQEHGGFLAYYTQDVNGEILNAAQIITMVAQNYSVNPRLLIALIEHRSRWLNDPAPMQTDYALNIADPTRPGLYRQLTYAANELNRGYYDWRQNLLSTWVLADGSVIPIDGGINAGTAGVQNFFSRLDDRSTWDTDVSISGLHQTYFFLFGSPFDYAVDPVVPDWLHQPRFVLPFERGVSWVYTSAPHGAWEPGYAWAALDFAPVVDMQGCFETDTWVTAVTDGVIVRTGNGQVIQDIDGDGYEQTGWVILYMHVESRDRVEPGTRVEGGDRIGHPSCEGGASNATHLHIARKYNGEWVIADGSIPFVMDGWTPVSAGTEYDGYLLRGEIRLEALEGITEVNIIAR
jgi:murein DD-endopeptidase MepM/ murein hydrolase activator NlpD